MWNYSFNKLTFLGILYLQCYFLLYFPNVEKRKNPKRIPNLTMKPNQPVDSALKNWNMIDR